MIKDKWLALSPVRRRNMLIAAGASLGVAVIGIALIATLAAGLVYDIEAEQNIAGNAAKITDPSASGGSALAFGSKSQPDGSGGTTAALQLKVASDGRSFVKADGTPFFWLGDTAWSLFVNLDRSEVAQYLDNRAGKGFNVIQAVAVGTPSGGNGPNRQGDSPFSGGLSDLSITPGNNPSSDAEYDYWDHVEYVIQEAAERNMYIGLLPVWSSSTANDELNTSNAQEYGEFLGERFGKKYSNIVWITGGDDNDGYFPEIWDNLTRGIAIGASGSEDYSKVLMTYHPGGGRNSADAFHDESWLDFNMHQSGHDLVDYNGGVWNNIDLSYNKTPAKPFVDGEPLYEQHPIDFDPSNGYGSATDVRQIAYISSFSGAAGHTYGHHNIWMFYGTPRGGSGASPKDIYWKEAMDAPGAQQMGYLQALMQSRARPNVFRVWDQGLIQSDTYGESSAAIRAIRGSDNSYLMVYSGEGRSFGVNTGALSGSNITAYWYDPRTGDATEISSPSKGSDVQFNPPSDDDWVLVVDDASKGYGQPGA